jgi:hypothetical protein
MHACKAPETPRELPLVETITTSNINDLIVGGEGGIRTHGTVTRTTVFEFEDSHAGVCRAVSKRVPLFAIFYPVMPTNDALCHTLPRGSFAISFANSSQLMSLTMAKRTVTTDAVLRQG